MLNSYNHNVQRNVVARYLPKGIAEGGTGKEELRRILMLQAGY